MRRGWMAIMLAAMIFGSACGDSGSALTPEPAAAAQEEATPETTSPAAAAAQESAPAPGGAGASFLEPSYAEGIWCSSDGTTWSISGGFASVSADGSTFTLAGHIDQIFVEPGAGLVSRGDDHFIMTQAGQEITFSRGVC